MLPCAESAAWSLTGPVLMPWGDEALTAPVCAIADPPKTRAAVTPNAVWHAILMSFIGLPQSISVKIPRRTNPRRSAMVALTR